MKYSVKVNISRQENTNAGEKDKHGNPLPVVLETVPVLGAVTDINVSGSLTPGQIESAVKLKFNVTTVVSESLIYNRTIISGSAPVTESNISYFAVLGPPTLPTGSISGSL